MRDKRAFYVNKRKMNAFELSVKNLNKKKRTAIAILNVDQTGLEPVTSRL